jgi:hypothetical protein
MKRLVSWRYRRAARAGLAAVRPRHDTPARGDDEREAARHGHHRGWFVVRIEQFGNCSRLVYAPGAVGSAPGGREAVRGVSTFRYEAAGAGLLAVGGGAVTTFSYDAARDLTAVASPPSADVGEGPRPAATP